MEQSETNAESVTVTVTPNGPYLVKGTSEKNALCFAAAEKVVTNPFATDNIFTGFTVFVRRRIYRYYQEPKRFRDRI